MTVVLFVRFRMFCNKIKIIRNVEKIFWSSFNHLFFVGYERHLNPVAPVTMPVLFLLDPARFLNSNVYLEPRKEQIESGYELIEL